MQQTRTMELGTGLFALLGIGALFFLTTQTTGRDDFNVDDTFTVEARFENVGSLKARAPVSMSGVTIGRVTDIRFDSDSLDAVVTFVIDSRYDQIPDDSDASILTAGLLGSQYIGLQAGGSFFYLEDGSEILGKFDLKHDTGAIVDIEFMVQYAVLAWGSRHDGLGRWTDVMRLLDELESAELIPEPEVEALQRAYLAFRAAVHHGWLGLDTDFERLQSYRQEVHRIWLARMEASDH